MNYYNEIDPYCVQWLKNLIAAGLIPAGDVDARSIADVRPSDLVGYAQCHFFAGLGGWSHALSLAGWPADRRVWTGSCPCQPFSHAGQRKGFDDKRHLWPAWFALIRECRPATVFGEQVASAKLWLDTVSADLEGSGYAFGAAILPAAGVGAPHQRNRIWLVAHALGAGTGRHLGNAQCPQEESESGWSADRRSLARSSVSCGTSDAPLANGQGQHAFPLHAEVGEAQEPVAHPDQSGLERWNGGIVQERPGECTTRTSSAFVTDATSFGRLERGTESVVARQAGWPAGDDWWEFEPDVGRVAHGIPSRVAKLRALGNAIVPQVAAEFIGAYIDVAP